MARSVGEAAAIGLERGMGLAMNMREQADRKDRQDRLDALAMEDRSTTLQRQRRQDQLGALDAQGKMLATEGLALSGGTPDEGTQRDFTGRVQKHQRAKTDLLSDIAGYDLGKQTELGMDALKRLTSGGELGPGEFTRAATVASRRPPTDYIRKDGQMSVIEQATQDFIDGMENDDETKMLAGINVMYAPELRTGVGSKSKHGTIVGKQIVGLDPDPRSPENDPHVVPRLRIYIKSDAAGPPIEPQPGVPEGATGYYDAPLTQRRSSDDDDPVRSVGVQEALDYLSKQGETVELMNSPEALRQLQLDADEGDFDPNQYITALASVGATGGKQTTSFHAVPAGGDLIEVTKDAQGRKVGERRILGREKQSSGQPAALQKNLDAIDAQGPDGTGLLTAAEVTSKKKALLDKTTTRSPGKSGGGSGGAGGPEKRIQSTKTDPQGYVIGVFRDGSARRLLVDGKPFKSQDFEKRIDKVAKDLAENINNLGKDPKDVREQARSTVLEGVNVEDKPGPNGKPKVHKPTSPADYEALPSGAHYEKNGKTYVKK